ncbi:MAG: Lrp/AsnC family transcriptional regulator [Candidatus Acididesulfobacter diazotrophicus]|jgi:DNA-binding Lrp family transcriptional regulator|uniref:siroheme decarboxylase n=1 Tax=Candidatus Acididesulfobacter diazotrophicus TaxID=2597226 RepID=A0A519BL96_9DELT|nr:MAG: Lrp/AsnC family transcriptional regulator [Candidatus Acididesulfobacter diazotrophicus]
MELDLFDKKILNILQTDFPISARPFQEIGMRLGISEEEVLNRILNLKQEKIIRQISAIFDSHNIGYKGTLAAFKVPECEIDNAASIINSYKGVSHNYLRNNPYNIWFTITLPPDKDFEEEISTISKNSKAEDYLILPTLKLFKIGVNFDMTEEIETANNKNKIDTKSYANVNNNNSNFRYFSQDDAIDDSKINISEFEKDCIRELQKDLEITGEPFKNAASNLNISQEELLYQISKFIEEKKMRRFACVLYHQKAGFSYNIMGIWKSKEDEIDKNGKIMASINEVSHCYQRYTYPNKWEYNIFTMIHTKNEEEALKTMDKIAELTGIKDFSSLKSIKEFKKVRVKYYL